MSLFSRIDSLPPSTDKSHHIGKPPRAFYNPWPSSPSTPLSPTTVFKARFVDERPPFVPVPSDRAELVQVYRPDFRIPPSCSTPSFQVTWIGHASFLVQCWFPGQPRPLGILFDPVFSERTSPVTFFGPKRYTPTPCSLIELLEAVPVDVVCISHNHYDHADTTTLKEIQEHQSSRGIQVVYCVGLGNPRWLKPLGISRDQIWEADWWDAIAVPLSGLSERGGLEPLRSEAGREGGASAPTPTPYAGAGVRITCTPSQHASKRGLFDSNADLWCSWSIELVDGLGTSTSTASIGTTMTENTLKHRQSTSSKRYKSLFFAGDTGYRTVSSDSLNNSTTPLSSSSSSLQKDKPTPDTTTAAQHQTSNDDNEINPEVPVCPAFRQIGNTLGPFDLALLPIGLCRPRHLSSPVHANSADSLDIHADINSKRSIGMHWGTVRGGLSQYYEDVRDPPREWEREAKLRRKIWRDRRSVREKESIVKPKGDGDGEDGEGGWEIGLLDVGESLII